MLRRTEWTADPTDGTSYCDFYIVSAENNIKPECPVESHDHSNDDLEDETYPFESVMCCSNCLAVIAKQPDLITEPAATLKEATFQYSLDMLDTPTQCYSATNEHDHRFDVSRFKASATNVELSKDTSDQYSWFPGHSWSIAACAECGQHLGWGFHDDNKAVAFYGLIVTSLRETPAKPFMRHVARARKENGNIRILLKCTFAGSPVIKERVMAALQRAG